MQPSITAGRGLLFTNCSCRPIDFPLRLRASRGSMVQRVATVAFEGIEARAVDVQVQVAPGLPAVNVVWKINGASCYCVSLAGAHEARHHDKSTPRVFVHPNVHRTAAVGTQRTASG